MATPDCKFKVMFERQERLIYLKQKLETPDEFLTSTDLWSLLRLAVVCFARLAVTLILVLPSS